MMTKDEIDFVRSIKYGLVLVDLENDFGIRHIHHFVGYAEQPQVQDIEELWEELRTDPELGFIGELDGLSIEDAHPEIVKMYKEDLLSSIDPPKTSKCICGGIY